MTGIGTRLAQATRHHEACSDAFSKYEATGCGAGCSWDSDWAWFRNGVPAWQLGGMMEDSFLVKVWKSLARDSSEMSRFREESLLLKLWGGWNSYLHPACTLYVATIYSIWFIMNVRWGLILIHIGTYRCAYCIPPKNKTKHKSYLENEHQKMQIVKQQSKNKRAHIMPQKETQQKHTLCHKQKHKAHTHTCKSYLKQISAKIKSQIRVRPETSKQNETQVMPEEKHTQETHK